MATIQELITKLNQTTEESQRTEFTEQLVSSIKNQEQLWAAFCPATKHYFLAQEHQQITAYVFSEESYYENFTFEMRKKHILLEKLENPKKHRMFLLAELYRCGVTQIAVDSEEEPIMMPLQMLVSVPDYSKLPLVQRPVLNPTVTGKILCLMQDVRFNRADGNTELDVLREIYHSPFLHPIHSATEDKPEENGIYQFPNGQKLFMLFTDLYSLKQFDPKDYPQVKIVRFADMQEMLKERPDVMAIIINPGSGAPMLLDSQLLEVAEKSASGILENTHIRNMNENAGKVVITKPELTPVSMIDHICTVLKETDFVKTAYLRNIRRDEEIRPHYLVILDWNGAVSKEEKAQVRRKIAEAAMPYARGLDIEYLSYDSAVGKEWTGNAEPIYELERSETFSEETTGKDTTKEKATEKAKTKKKGFLFFGKK
ncbi:MAG: enhanced serine sensitivity protein SseB [Oscillospiraceae bacterium]|nr:enhanced serine sensitivity protein SseB [Oscillospiraceae bacterium]